MNKVSIVLVDDHQLILDGLRSIIESYPAFEIVAEANNGEELLNILEVLSPDVVLLDVDMPKLDGLEVLEILSRRENPRPKVIMLTMHAEKGIVQKSIDLGTKGFLLKSTSKENLITAIEQVHDGNEYFSPELTRILTTDGQTNSIDSVFNKFTRKEQEVAQGILNGKHTKEIAVDMGISSRTVETHRANLMRKAGVTHLAELIHVLNTSK
jgi:DNA-binding NarL/FixJ family response regulator